MKERKTKRQELLWPPSIKKEVRCKAKREGLSVNEYVLRVVRAELTKST